jgi:hypothetical protein
MHCAKARERSLRSGLPLLLSNYQLDALETCSHLESSSLRSLVFSVLRFCAWLRVAVQRAIRKLETICRPCLSEVSMGVEHGLRLQQQ